MKKWFNRLSALALASFLFTTATVFAADPDFSSLGATSDNAFDTTQARDGDTVTFTLTINVAEDSDGTGQVTFDVGATTGLTATFPAAASSTTHTATYAVPAGQDGAISVTNITFVNTGAESLINTPGFPHTLTPNVTLDNTDPRITTIVRQNPASSPTNSDTVIWRVTLDELARNLDTADFTITGTTATVTNVVPHIPAFPHNIYDVTVTGGDLATLNGTITLGIAGGQNILDEIGNPLTNTTPTTTNDNTYLLDNTAPTTTENTAVVTPGNDTTPDVTINTNEAGTLTMGGSCGTSSSTSLSSGNTTITLTQPDNSTPLAAGTYADCTVTVTDASGNANAATALTSFTIDLTAPTTTENTAVVTPGNDTTPDVTINTNEAGTLTMGGSCGTSSSTSLSSGNTTITLTQPDNSTPLVAGTYADCTVTVTDASGNANAATALTSFTIDLSDPDVSSIVRQSPVASPTNADTLVWRVTFSKAVQNVDLTDFGIAGTTATLAVSTISTSVYDVTASGGDLASLDATATLSFSGGQNVTDLASNTLSSTTPTGTNNNTFVVDNTAPTVTETTAVTDPTGDSTPDVVINTDEAGTLTMGGSCGTSSSTTLGTGDTTITLTQPDNSTALSSATYSDCTVQITDASGNANAATALTSFEVDTIAPVISEVTPISDPTSDNTPDYTFTTDEAGTITYGGDCSSATTAAVIGNNTVTFNTLADGIHSNCTIQVTDDVSNASTVLNVPAFRVDTIAPSVQSATVATSGNPGFARETQTVTFSVTFNEAVTVTAVNTASDGTSVSNVTTEFDAAASTTDQLIFTVQAGDNGNVVPVVDFDIQDAAGLTTNITSLGTITGTVIEADTTAPTLTPVSIASNNADTSLAITGNNVIVSFTGSEALTGVSGTVFTEVAAASNTGGDDWTLTLMTSGDEAEGLAPFTADFSDLAGNAGTQVTAVTDASSVTYDNTPAMVSSASIISGHTYITDAPVYYAGVGQTITLTIDPTEPIQTPTGAILGLAPVFTNTVGDIWTATVTTAGGETEGTVTYSIDIIDLAGTGTPLNVSATTDGTSVVFDETAPTNPTTVLDVEGVATVSPKSVISALFNWTGETDALAGVAEFVVRFENTTTGINETSTITLPVRDFTPAAVVSSSDAYNVYISTVDKAGNVLAEALLYSQIYAGSLTGTVTDANTGAPIEGALVNVIAKYGERCSLNQEICVATTDAAGNYELVINPSQEYKIDFLKLPNYRINKQSFTAGITDLSASAQLTNVEDGTTQTGDQRVVYNVVKDGETVEVTIFSFSGEASASRVTGGMQFTSFGRIVQAETNKDGVELVHQGNNVWFLEGASMTGAATGVKIKSVQRITGSSSGGGFSGMTRAQNATKGRVLTPAESMAFIKEMNAGSEGQTLYYTNHNGKKIFAGYVKGRLAMMVFAKNSKTPVVYRGYRRERQGYDKDQASVSANQVAINNALNKNKMLKTQKVKSVATVNRYESMRQKMAATGQSMPSYINRKDSSARTANMVKYRNDMVAAKENKFARSNGFTQTESRIAKNRKANEQAKLNVIKSTKGVASIMRMIKAEQMQASVINTQEVVSR